MRTRRGRSSFARPRYGLSSVRSALTRPVIGSASMRAAPPRSAGAPQPLASLAGSGTLAQALPGAQVAALDDRRLRVTAGDVSWGALLDWIANARAQHGLDVAAARIEALPMTGRVKADLTLERP